MAGAVSQTNILDYRDKGLVSNVGIPLTSVEIYLTGEEEGGALEGERPRGKVSQSGFASCFSSSISLHLFVSAKNEGVDTDPCLIPIGRR